MAIKTLKLSDLSTGKPVDWHIYDGSGRLLLKKGMRIQSKRQIAKLITLNSFRRVDKNEIVVNDDIDQISNALNPFSKIDRVLDHLDRLFKVVVYKAANPERKLAEKFYELSNGIIKLCEYDLDATIGVIHIGKEYNYTIIHPLNCAIICYSLAIQLGIKDQRLNSIICAALTSNLGMFDLQSELVMQNGPLTVGQRDFVEKHTMRSAILLKRIGVYDKLWMEIVLQHHERQDGTGYPRQFSGKKFIREARILGLADRYHAMVTPRSYRDSMSPTVALKRIFQDRGAEVDAKLGTILIKEMGIYPPGAVVKLNNHETAVVTRRNQDRTKPYVKSIFSAEGQPYMEPIQRDSADNKFRIMGLTNVGNDYQFDIYKLWDYNLE